MSPHEQDIIDTPYFMFNSKYDEWQMGNILQSKCAANRKIKCNDTQQADVLVHGVDFMTQFAPVLVSKHSFGIQFVVRVGSTAPGRNPPPTPPPPLGHQVQSRRHRTRRA